MELLIVSVDPFSYYRWGGAVDMLPPNFYEAAARKILPDMSVRCSFVPDPRTSRIFRLAAQLTSEQRAIDLAVVAWVLRNWRCFDVVLGFQGLGVAIAALRGLWWRRTTRVSLVVYRLYNRDAPWWLLKIKRLIIRLASRGCDLLLSVSEQQAREYEVELRRAPNTTKAFTYGVDTEFFDTLLERTPQPTVKPRTIFCPGSAARDDGVLLSVVRDLNCDVTRFRLSAGAESGSRRRFSAGTSTITEIFNAPYTDYVASCREAAVVLLPVDSRDKPVGLTALLECMALGRPVVITRGYSSEGYVRDANDGFVVDATDIAGIRSLLERLFADPEEAERIGGNAHTSSARHHALKLAGEQLGTLLLGLMHKSEV